MRESTVTSHICLDAAQRGVDLWRNNVGGFYDNTGRFVRYGLGSFTEKDKCKSSDYIGITPLFITPEHVGQIIGVFTAVEMKSSDWKFNSNDKHCLYQRNFLDMVLKDGGYAGFATNIKDFRRIIKHETR